MDEGPLGIHEVKLVVQPGPGFSNGSGVAEHADSAWNLGQVSTRNNSRWLVVDADLEASGTPIHKLDGPLGLDGCNGSIDILGDNITAIQHATSHVLAMTRIAFDHLVGWFEASIGDLSHGELLVVSLLSRDDWGISDQREMDTRIGHQVSLEFSQVNVEGTIESERSGDG